MMNSEIGYYYVYSTLLLSYLMMNSEIGTYYYFNDEQWNR